MHVSICSHGPELNTMCVCMIYIVRLYSHINKEISLLCQHNNVVVASTLKNRSWLVYVTHDYTA